MASDLNTLAEIRGWLTESLLAYLRQVLAEATEPPHYFPRRLRARGDVLNVLWRRLHVRARAQQSALLGVRGVRGGQEDLVEPGYGPLRPKESVNSRVEFETNVDEETATRYPRAVITGDPGAGKSWLLLRIARRTAEAALKALDKDRDRTVREIAWPIRVRLPELARSPRVPLDALLLKQVYQQAELGLKLLPEHRGRLGGSDPAVVASGETPTSVSPRLASLVLEAITSGRAYLLLDAWDEVPLERRKELGHRLHEFAEAFPRARLLVTTRDGGGLDPAILRPPAGHGDIPEDLELLALDPEQVDAFCNTWFDGFPLPRQPARVLRQVLDRHPPLRALGRNPLMLTFMARLAEESDDIPMRRVELYDRVLRGLLSAWPREDLKSPDVYQIEQDEVDDDLRLLAGVSNALVDEGVINEMTEARLRSLIERCQRGLFKVRHRFRRRDARVLLNRWIKAGILAPIGGGAMQFLHRTLQEYVTGMALVPRTLIERSGSSVEWQTAVERCAEAIAKRLQGTEEDDDWQEPIRLGLAYLGLVEGRRDACEAVIKCVIERAPGPGGLAVAAMGEVVADIAPDTRTRVGTLTSRDGVTPTFRASVVETVREHIGGRSQGVQAKERIACGNSLARLGDPRFQGAHRGCLPNDELWGFVRIEQGSFVMGSDVSQDPTALADEQPLHTVALEYDYWIARWPVTVAQFRAFVCETGFVPGDPSCLDGIDNHPVVLVRWHEALSYCAWLTEQMRRIWRDAPAGLRAVLQAGGEVCLPSEAEWERAARGRTGRRHPWGNQPANNERANYADTGIGTTSAVGCFPEGATPEGVEDLAGNVWEWTRSKKASYPYRADDGREDLAGDGSRVIRGGAFYYGVGDVRSASRSRRRPDRRGAGYGFRVVVSPYLLLSQSHFR